MATRMTNLSLSRGVLHDINNAQARLARTQEKLSSGKELTKPSDNPVDVARAMHLRSEMEGAQQFQRNVADAFGWAEVTDSALGSINDALLRTRELAIQGANDTAGEETRTAIAHEIRGLIDSVKTAGNAMFGGRYVFAGTDTGSPPYAMGASDTYGGDENAINRQIGPGVTVSVNVNGRETLGDENQGLLLAMRQVLAHLENNDGASLRGEVANLDGALANLNAVRARIGAVANRLDVAGSRLAEYEGTTLKLLSETESTDMAKAMVDYSVQQAALTAGLKAGAQIVQTSLLDFLR